MLPENALPHFGSRYGLIGIMLCLCLATGLKAQDYAKDLPAELIDENAASCLNCHSKIYFSYYNDWKEDSVKRRMCESYHILPEEYYKSNHKTFRCVDCHSEDFTTYPHDANLRMEPKYECMDCHGGDDFWAMYNFEAIYEEYAESVHASLFDQGFSCWSCHNPHEYHISIRNTENLRETIAYDNAICLNCHSNIDNYQLVTSKENPDILVSHEWLPNQRLHFAAVRCIECHTEVNDSILVAHKILPGDKAVKNCVECHSSNSRLLETLYRFEKKQTRNAFGFVNGVLINDSTYVIGANRNIFLNVASIVIFGLTLLGIFVHAILRLTIKK